MLMEHNKETYEQFKAMLLAHKECCLVAATGAGKTYITLQLIKDLKLKALIICHRISIQNEWSKTINQFNINNIEYTTYQMFCKHADMFNGYDIYIFDEAHHMGSKIWGDSITRFRSNLNDTVMVAGLTADPNRYEYRIGRQINNVAFTMFNGHVVYGHDKKDAIENGIFLPAQYVYAIFDIDEIYSKYSKMKVTDELMGRLNLNIENCLKINEILIKHTSRLSKIKGILFVEDIASIDDGQKLISDVFPDLDQYVIHSKISKSKNSISIESFERSDSGFIIAVDMISEGVHFSNINTIIMLRKTKSPSLYNQQIGRGFSSKALESAVIFDLVGNLRSVKSTLNKFLVECDYRTIRPSRTSSIWEENVSNQYIIYDYATDILEILDEIDQYNLKVQKWTNGEKDIIKKFYPIMGSEIVSMLPGRDKKSIRSMAYSMGIKYINDKWTTEEDEIIRKHYPSMGSKVSELLPKRNPSTIRIRAIQLNVKYTALDWTPEEDRILREYYPSMAYDIISLLPNKNKIQISDRVKTLKIRYEKFWTPEEDEIIRKHYPSMGSKVSELLKNRSRSSCIHRGRVLGIKYINKCIPWTTEEDEILRKYYPSMNTKVSEMLNGRTPLACKGRAEKLKITRNIPHREWTPEEDEILVKHYKSIGASGVAKLLKRSRSSVSSRIKLIGKCTYSSPKWSDEEIDILKKEYPSIGYAGIQKLLPNRSKSSIMIKASKLGIVRSKK